ncbi:hypothetical protein ALC60_09142 [Trachymyrmex zeteki]|uniref:Uncharacterized protein n=1 Tax=Mycetomoellerius zeteki TaxID=64791 RepID=A0A151WV69_9HYME|nr:hypothetical protein ALC60_09142 [Trachymyrmex zeteki]
MQSKASKYAKCIASDQGYQVSAEKQNLLEPRAIERYVSVLTPSVVSKPKKVSAICENEICKMTCSN